MKKQILFFVMFASMMIVANAQVNAPIISFDCQDGETEVTITNTDGAEIWYNFTGSNSTDNSQRYFGSFKLTAPTDVTAFSVNGDNKSDIVSKRVVVRNAKVRIDLLNVLNPSMGYSIFADNEGYCFSWKDEPTSGKNEKVVWEEWVWSLVSKGQVMQVKQMENNAEVDYANYEKDRPASPESFMDKLLFTQSYQTLYDDILFFSEGAAAEDCAEIRSDCKYQGAFDVIVLASKEGTTKELSTLKLETSPDGENWTKAGTIDLGLANHWVFNRIAYEGLDEVYIRVVPVVFGSTGTQVHGIYIVNNGEQSQNKKKEYDEEYETWLATNINSVSDYTAADDAYYTLSGVKLNGKPTEMGLYICNGKKVYVK